MCSVLFLLLAYITKAQSIIKSEEYLLLDDNVWNDKNTDDFLRYLKLEYFLLTYVITNLSFDCVVAFSNIYDLPDFGDRDADVVKYCMYAVIASRAISVFHILYRMKKGAHKIDKNIEAEIRKGNIAIYIHIGLDVILVIFVLYLYLTNNYLLEYNLVVSLWVMAEMIGIFVQSGYFLVVTR